MNVVSHGCTLCSLPREVWMKQRQALLEKDKTFLPLTLQVSLSLSFHSWGCICLSLQSPNAITVNNNEIYLCKRSSLFSMDCSLSLEVLFLLQESEKKRNSSRQYHHDDGPEVTLCCSLFLSLSLSRYLQSQERQKWESGSRSLFISIVTSTGLLESVVLSLIRKTLLVSLSQEMDRNREIHSLIHSVIHSCHSFHLIQFRSFLP